MPNPTTQHHDLEIATPSKRVPQERGVRERIRREASTVAATFDRSRGPTRGIIERAATELLGRLDLDASYLGWTMVAVSSAFWEASITRVPPERRLLLLPHCLRRADRCRAKYDELGLSCEDCGLCSLSRLGAEASRRGYHTLIAEGSPIVMQLILSGQIDAVMGVACLDSLEKAFDKVTLAGLPGMAVPLLGNGCRDTTSDEDWIREMIATPYRPGGVAPRSWVGLLRRAASIFEPEELKRLSPRRRGQSVPRSFENADDEAEASDVFAGDPVAVTETIALEFLQQGGKHFRPFIALAARDAMLRGSVSTVAPTESLESIPDSALRVALAIEVFHKASLVHDDIEDDDPFRYGRRTLHRRYGIPTAMNVGDYLIGLGYRLVSHSGDEQDALPPEVVADLVAAFSTAHTRLCEGQGAELAWRDALNKRLSPADALRIHALKTAPAFEAALYAGLRVAGDARPYAEAAARFSRHVGVAYQILNDLSDWSPEQPNKRTAGTDALSGRPTILWALALQKLSESEIAELEALAVAPIDEEERLQRIGAYYRRVDAFDRARTLVVRHRHRAAEIAQTVPHAALRELLEYFLEVLL